MTPEEATTPRESWLRSRDHDRWAAAMSLCQHPLVDCHRSGQCAYGTCFVEVGQDALQRRLAALEARVARLEVLRGGDAAGA